MAENEKINQENEPIEQEAEVTELDDNSLEEVSGGAFDSSSDSFADNGNCLC